MKALYTFALLAAAVLITACNTVDGMGKDIERGGEKIQKATGH